MTYVPTSSAGSVNSRPLSDQLPASAGPALVPEGPRRGYRARPAAEIAHLIKDLAQQIAGAVAEHSGQADHPGVITLVATPLASWYPVLAAALADTESGSHVPVRGTTDLITAAAAVPPALDALGAMARGAARRVHGPSLSGRSPLVSDAELGGLWLNAAVAALHQPSPGRLQREVRVAGLGLPRTGLGDSWYVLAAAVPATLIWRRGWRRQKKNQDPALAQWLLIDADRNVVAGGIVTSSPSG